MRTLRMLAALALACAAITGCAPPGFACSAVYYPVTAQVVLSEPRAGATLQLCGGEGCDPGPPMVPEQLPSSGLSPKPANDSGVMSIGGDGGSGWSAEMLGGQPVLGYRVADASGAVVGEGFVDVHWVQLGGTEECGGPREAHVELPI